MKRNRASPLSASPAIACVKTFRLSCPLAETMGYSQGRLESRQALLVQIVASDGAEGWGECAGPASVVQAAIATIYAPLLLGQPSLQTELLWQAMWQASRPHARRGATIGALSGLDMALWDLKGHAQGLSVSDLLGGRRRDRVPACATGLYFRDCPEARIIPLLMDEAHGYADAGFRAVRAQIGRNPAFDMALTRALRAALPTTTLLADACHAYDLGEAMQVGATLAECGYAFFEEPMPPELLCGSGNAGRALYAAHPGVPLACGRFEQTAPGFDALLSGGAVGLAAPDLAWCGGLTEAVRIRNVAQAKGVNVAPRSSGATMLGLAAALHFLASDSRRPGRAESAGVGFLDIDTPEENPLRDALFAVPLPIEGGVVTVPAAPGLGVTVDEPTLKMFCMERAEFVAR